MKTETKILGIILLITAVLLVGGIFFLAKQSSPGVKGTQSLQIDYSKGQKIGSDSAKVKLVEFSDFECPACAIAETPLKNIRIREGVQFIYRHFPLPQHKYGKLAASFAEAASIQGKFWEMHQKLFETQSQWSSLSETDATAFFQALTKDLQLDEVKINESLKDDAIKEKIENDLAEGRNLGVNATPTFFLNGVKLNLQRFEDLDKLISEELQK